jgi:hypothetical protein
LTFKELLIEAELLSFLSLSSYSFSSLFPLPLFIYPPSLIDPLNAGLNHILEPSPSLFIPHYIHFLPLINRSSKAKVFFFFYFTFDIMAPRSFKPLVIAVSGTFPGYKQGTRPPLDLVSTWKCGDDEADISFQQPI